jgi:hypothetical protein
MGEKPSPCDGRKEVAAAAVAVVASQVMKKKMERQCY